MLRSGNFPAATVIATAQPLYCQFAISGYLSRFRNFNCGSIDRRKGRDRQTEVERESENLAAQHHAAPPLSRLTSSISPAIYERARRLRLEAVGGDGRGQTASAAEQPPFKFRQSLGQSQPHVGANDII